MKCETASSMLSEYISEELSPQRTRAIEDHLEHCPGCRSGLAALQRAIHDLRRPMTVFEAPDVLSAVKERVQHRRKPLFRAAAVWGLAGAAALTLMICWSSVRSPEPVAVNHSPPVTAGAQTTDPTQPQQSGLAVAEDAPDPADPPQQAVQPVKQAQHQAGVAAEHPEHVQHAPSDVDQIPVVNEVEPERAEVAHADPVTSPTPPSEPGELRYQCVNGQGYVYRELGHGPNGTRARVDVIVVPGGDGPDCYSRMRSDTIDRLARAEHIIERQEGAM